MPGTDFADINFCWSPKDAVVRAAAQALFVSFDGPMLGPTLTEYNGYRAYVVTRIFDTGPVASYSYIFVMVSLPAGANMSAQDFTQDETQIAANCHYGIEGVVSGTTWDEFVEAFTEVFSNILTEFIEEVCEAFIEIGEGSDLTFAEDEAAVLGIPVTILVDSNVIVIQMTLIGTVTGYGPVHNLNSQFYRFGQSKNQNQIQAGAQDFAKIVEALQDIAMQEYEISLNNGSSIFRVRGKSTITGPGGGG